MVLPTFDRVLLSCPLPALRRVLSWVLLMEVPTEERLDEEQATRWGHRADVLSHWWGLTPVKTEMWVHLFILMSEETGFLVSMRWFLLDRTAAVQLEDKLFNLITLDAQRFLSELSVNLTGYNTCTVVKNGCSGNLTHLCVQKSS